MTMEKFQMMHSMLIEHYQYIEHHLEGVYALLCGKSFYEGLEEVETSNIKRLIQEIKRMDEKKVFPLFRLLIMKSLRTSVSVGTFGVTIAT